MTQDQDNQSPEAIRKDAGFSLVELLVTVSIMALLATAVVISVGPVLGKSRVDRARSDIAALESGLEQYSFWQLSRLGLAFTWPLVAVGIAVVILLLLLRS